MTSHERYQIVTVMQPWLYSWRSAGSAAALRRLAKFGLVGVSGIAINMVVFWLLVERLHLHYLLAGPVAIEASVFSNYALNNRWTFADRGMRLLDRRCMARYHAVAFGGMVINLAMLHVLVGVVGIQPLLANLGAIVVSTSGNFLLHTAWTWRRPRSSRQPGRAARGRYRTAPVGEVGATGD